LVKRGELAGLRVVREERGDVGPAAEHVVDETLQRLLGPDLDERPDTLGVERLEPFDPLHRGGHLLRQQVLDRLDARRVDVARDVGHERDARRRDPQPIEHAPQRR
jgi:hypothetical protein